MTERDLLARDSLLASGGADASCLPDLLALIAGREPYVNAFVHLDPAALDPGPPVPHGPLAPRPLAGRVVSVKDNIAVRGAPWAAGSASRLNNPATRDAELVTRLRAAGAVVIGTTNLDEFAMGASTDSSHWGPTHNPWDFTRTAGGSSGGSAASVAAYGVLSVGTDTGGSVREPAAQCGIVGVKPSGREIPFDGVLPFAPTWDAVGPLAPDVAAAAALDDVLRGRGDLSAAARRGARTRRLTGMRIGVVQQQTDGRNSPEVRSRFDLALRALQAAGADLDDVSFPSINESLALYMDLTSVEAVTVLAAHERRGAGLGPEAARRLEHGRSLTGTRRVRRAQQDRARVRRQLQTAAARYFALLSPTMPITAPRLGALGLDDPLGTPRTDWWTVEANLAGLGAMSLPCGLGSGSELPVGLQIMVGPGQDHRMYGLGAWLEAAGVNG